VTWSGAAWWPQRALQGQGAGASPGLQVQTISQLRGRRRPRLELPLCQNRCSPRPPCCVFWGGQDLLAPTSIRAELLVVTGAHLHCRVLIAVLTLCALWFYPWQPARTRRPPPQLAEDFGELGVAGRAKRPKPGGAGDDDAKSGVHARNDQAHGARLLSCSAQPQLERGAASDPPPSGLQRTGAFSLFAAQASAAEPSLFIWTDGFGWGAAAAVRRRLRMTRRGLRGGPRTRPRLDGVRRAVGAVPKTPLQERRRRTQRARARRAREAARRRRIAASGRPRARGTRARRRLLLRRRLRRRRRARTRTTVGATTAATPTR